MLLAKELPNGVYAGSSAQQSLRQKVPMAPLSDDDATQTSRSARICFLKLIIDEAISCFDQNSPTEKDGRGNAKNSVPIRWTRGGMAEAATPIARVVWGMWVLETIMRLSALLETKSAPSGRHAEASCETASVGSASADESMSLVDAVRSAESPCAFAAVLLSACSGRLDTAARSSAHHLCAEMLRASLSHVPTPNSLTELTPDKEIPTSPAPKIYGHSSSRHSSFAPCGYELRSQEHAVVHSFAVQLRSEVNSRSLSSPLLQSKLDLLAQWMHRRLVMRNKMAKSDMRQKMQQSPARFPVTTATKSSFNNYSSLESVDGPGHDREKCWDVASAVIAGPFSGSERFGEDRVSHASAGGPQGPNVLARKASDLLDLMVPSTPDQPLCLIYNSELLVEIATSTSVTLSWGGWSHDKRGSRSTVDVDGFSLACRSSPRQGSRESKLARKLRSTAKNAVGCRQDHSSLVLQVCLSSFVVSIPSTIHHM